MDRKDLITMASEAGFGQLLTGDGLPTMWHGADLEMLERFAGLVAGAERGYWQNAMAIMLVARSGQVTGMDTAERLAKIVADERSNSN